MRPSSCVPAPWAPADVPLCTIGDDLEVLMPGLWMYCSHASETNAPLTRKLALQVLPGNLNYSRLTESFGTGLAKSWHCSTETTLASMSSLVYIHLCYVYAYHTTMHGIHRYIGNTHDRRAPSTEDVHKQGLSKQGLQGVYDGPVRASVLDFGADISGQQYQVFSRYFDVRCVLGCCSIHLSHHHPHHPINITHIIQKQGPMIGWNVRTPHGNFKPTEKLQAQDMGNFSLVFGERDSCLPFQGSFSCLSG